MKAYRQINKLVPVKKPDGLDPFEIMKERENLIQQKIQYRIATLESLPAKLMSDELRLKVFIELKALRLLEFQKSLRSDIVSCMRADTTLETSLNPKAYKRCKRQTLREARVTEKMERIQKQEAERKKRLKHMEYLNAVVEHSKNFKEVHRANVAKCGKMAKAVMSWHTNTERIQKKEAERLEKERMKMLMNEDEEGYRKLVNEKKDMRLAFLLSQTDEYIDSLTALVADHQADLARKKAGKTGKKGDKGKEGFVRVHNPQTGEMLEGDDAPSLAELDAWLELNHGWEVISRPSADEIGNETAAEDDNSNSNAASETEVTSTKQPQIGPDGEVILPQVHLHLTK